MQQYILSVVSGKEKVVRAILSKSGVECRTPPSLSGYLILDASMPPYKIYELPHVIGMVLATPDQIERLMAPYKPAKIETGMRVQVLRGDYAGLYGRIRRIIGNGNEVIVDLGLYGRMAAIRISCNDVEQA
ncbi:MAG TPA: hypothetical protein PK344_14860 [Syntrophorhabdaceae bacterium]|jgi:transcription antitermination factor NusG|nr:hypothetical protein [Syntrophorhabdaceae bacterium]